MFWLSQVGTDKAVTALDSILRRSPDRQLQEKALFALSQHESPRARAALRTYAERADVPDELRAKAMFWIGQRYREDDADASKSAAANTAADGRGASLGMAGVLTLLVAVLWVPLAHAITRSGDERPRVVAVFAPANGWQPEPGGTRGDAVRGEAVRSGGTRPVKVTFASFRSDASAPSAASCLPPPTSVSEASGH